MSESSTRTRSAKSEDEEDEGVWGAEEDEEDEDAEGDDGDNEDEDEDEDADEDEGGEEVGEADVDAVVGTSSSYRCRQHGTNGAEMPRRAKFTRLAGGRRSYFHCSADAV